VQRVEGPINTGDSRCAALRCSVLRTAEDGLKGRCSTAELRPWERMIPV